MGFSNQYSINLNIKSDIAEDYDWRKSLPFDLLPALKSTANQKILDQKPNFKFDEESITFDKKSYLQDYATFDTILNVQHLSNQYQSINPFSFQHNLLNLLDPICYTLLPDFFETSND